MSETNYSKGSMSVTVNKRKDSKGSTSVTVNKHKDSKGSTSVTVNKGKEFLFGKTIHVHVRGLSDVLVLDRSLGRPRPRIGQSTGQGK